MSLVDDVQAAISSQVPEFKIASKKDSLLLKIADRAVVRWFNPTFMTGYTTTIGTTIYVPDMKDVQDSFSEVLSHEGMHMYDSKRDSMYSIKYLIPQILALPALVHAIIPVAISMLIPNRVAAMVTALTLMLASIVLAAVFISPWTLILASLLLFALPLPAYWRMLTELRGYQMSVAFSYWQYGDSIESFKSAMATHGSYVDYFTSSAYYFMWPFKSSMLKRLYAAVDEVASGEVLKDPYFSAIHSVTTHGKQV